MLLVNWGLYTTKRPSQTSASLHRSRSHTGSSTDQMLSMSLMISFPSSLRRSPHPTPISSILLPGTGPEESLITTPLTWTGLKKKANFTGEVLQQEASAETVAGDVNIDNILFRRSTQETKQRSLPIAVAKGRRKTGK